MKDKQAMIAFIFSVIGVLFSGYLSFTKLILGSCPLSEGCPVFLGYPACYFGLVLFAILLVISSRLAFKEGTNYKKAMTWLMYVSLFGILFAVYSTYTEYANPPCLGGVCNYSLLLPTCVYGLIMYIVIFIAAWLGKKKVR